jgi:hypothetical protein
LDLSSAGSFVLTARQLPGNQLGPLYLTLFSGPAGTAEALFTFEAQNFSTTELAPQTIAVTTGQLEPGFDIAGVNSWRIGTDTEGSVIPARLLLGSLTAVAAVPEPHSVALVAVGLGLLALARRARRK